MQSKVNTYVQCASETSKLKAPCATIARLLTFDEIRLSALLNALDFCSPVSQALTMRRATLVNNAIAPQINRSRQEQEIIVID